MGDGIQIAVVRPRNFRDGATIGEYFRQEIPVIINLEDMDNAEAERIIDFASGLILGLCGDIERLSRRTFLIVPAGADILTTHNALTEEGFFNQALQSPGQWLVGAPHLPQAPEPPSLTSRRYIYRKPGVIIAPVLASAVIVLILSVVDAQN